MIFVTVGSQLPFDRLVSAVDRYAPTLGKRIFAQIGPSNFKPAHIEYTTALSPNEYNDMLRDADLVVAHAGIGIVLQARAMSKPLIVYPRRYVLGEHRNDHQLATARALANASGIRVVYNEDELLQAMQAGPFDVGASNEVSPERKALIAALKAQLAR